MQRESPKLVSSFEHSHPLTDFTENIFYLLQWKNMKIKEIKSIVSFKCYEYLKPYITHLQLARKNAPSAILGKCIKSLGMHTNQWIMSCLISACLAILIYNNHITYHKFIITQTHILVTQETIWVESYMLACKLISTANWRCLWKSSHAPQKGTISWILNHLTILPV